MVSFRGTQFPTSPSTTRKTIGRDFSTLPRTLQTLLSQRSRDFRIQRGQNEIANLALSNLPQYSVRCIDTAILCFLEDREPAQIGVSE